MQESGTDGQTDGQSTTSYTLPTHSFENKLSFDSQTHSTLQLTVEIDALDMLWYLAERVILVYINANHNANIQYRVSHKKKQKAHMFMQINQRHRFGNDYV